MREGNTWHEKYIRCAACLFRGGIRGGRADENARPSRRRRTGKTDAEHERLRAREKGVEDSAIAERGGDRPAVEEPEEGASRRLSHRAEAAEAHTGSIKAQKHRRRLRHGAEETRSISRTEEAFDTFGGNGAGERTAKPGRQTAGAPAVRGRAAQVESGNARKQRQRKQAGSFRQGGEGRERRPPKVLRESQTRRSNGLLRSPLFKNARA